MNLSLSLSKKLGLALLSLVVAAPALVLAESIADRLQPVGELCMAGDPCAAAVAESAAGGEPRSGEAVYSTKCFTCHATGAAGAPKFGDAAAWSARLDERGLDGMYSSAVNGFNGMPPKGLCMDCSEEELHNAVDHILANSK